MTEEISKKTDAAPRNGARRDDKKGRLKDYSVILASIVVVLGGIHCARGILGPMFIAAFFAALLISPVRWLRSKGIAQWLAMTVVIIGVLTIGLGTITVVGAQLTQFAKNIPAYRDAFNEKLMNYNLNVDDFIPFLKEDESQNGKENAPAENELALERFREYERERALRGDEKKNDASAFESGNDASPKTNAPNEREKTKAFSERIVPVSFRVENGDGEKSTVDAISETAATENVGTNSRGLFPQASDADSRLTPGRVDANDAGLIPATPRPVLTADSTSENADVPKTSTDANAETDATLADDSKFDSTSENVGAGNDDEFFEWRAKEGAVDAVNAGSQELFRFLAGLVGELSYLASNAFIIALLVIFMLCEAAAIPQKLVAALGTRRFTNSHIQNVVADIRNYMVIKTWMSVGVGVCVTILLVVSDVQYPLLWGFVAFLLNYIPNIGSVVAAIPPIVLATVEHGLVVGAVDAAFFVFINCFIGYVIEPRLLGNGLDLSPLIVLISLILSGWILGPIGMFLSPPLAVIIKIIFQSFPETNWLAVLMANRPPKEPLVVDEE